MTGELFAILSAASYGIGGYCVAEGARTARGDNGMYLSVLMTCAVTLVLWLVFGSAGLPDVLSPGGHWAMLLFVLAGVFSMVVGRLLNYRATALIGAVSTSLYRRLVPVLAVPVAFLMLSEVPEVQVLAGGALILMAVLLGVSRKGGAAGALGGHGLAIGSAAGYALALGFRRLGLMDLPDPMLGTFVGAITGLLWFTAAAALRRDRAEALSRLFRDLGPWQFAGAAALTAGQTLQFFALRDAEVTLVAVLAALDVFFTAGLVALAPRGRSRPALRVWLGAVLALAGTAIVLT